MRVKYLICLFLLLPSCGKIPRYYIERCIKHNTTGRLYQVMGIQEDTYELKEFASYCSGLCREGRKILWSYSQKCLNAQPSVFMNEENDYDEATGCPEKRCK